MALDGQEYRQIQEALLDAYRGEPALRHMVRFELNENLASIAGGENLNDTIFNLIEWADGAGRIRELIQAAHKDVPANPLVRQLYDAWFSEVAVGNDLLGETLATPQIFLSYNRLDAEFKNRLGTGLSAAGFSVWTDEGLVPGTQRWQAAIEQTIYAKCNAQK